jgi:hypothetical protein
MMGAKGDHPSSRRRKLSPIAKRVGNPEAKRLRLFDIPPVQNGVISASKTPTADSGRLVYIKVQEVDDISLFFDNVGELTAQNVKSALASTWANEESLRS